MTTETLSVNGQSPGNELQHPKKGDSMEILLGIIFTVCCVESLWAVVTGTPIRFWILVTVAVLTQAL